MRPYYDDGTVTVYEAGALDLLHALPDASVQLVATDPPYFRVKDEGWDRAWDSERAFLRWIRDLCREWRRVLAPNGSLYVFASPQMAHGVERVVRRHFRVLNFVRWEKPKDNSERRHLAQVVDSDEARRYYPTGERVVFAEQVEPTRNPFADALLTLRTVTGMTRDDVDLALGHVRTKNPNRGTELCRRWEEGACNPTADQWGHIREVLGAADDHASLLREYEDLRRPFNATPDSPYTDVWDFPTVAQYPGKHPCEKPLAMMEHIVRLSSRPGDTVLDTFSGSGTTAEAARNLGRRAIVGDNDPHWVRYTAERISQGMLNLGGAA